MTTLTDPLNELELGPSRPLRALDEGDLTAKYKPGIYTLWLDGQFLYTGISYRASDPTSEADGKWGIWGRLRTHLHGESKNLPREIMARFVIPELTLAEIESLRTGGYAALWPKLQRVLGRIEFRVWIADAAEARALEKRIRREGLRHAGRPLLNPSS